MNVLAGGNSDLTDPYWKTFFIENTTNYDYFLITNMSELDAQPVLKEMLSHYPAVKGDGYILYDLNPQ